jgi:hypothetical protein
LAITGDAFQIGDHKRRCRRRIFDALDDGIRIRVGSDRSSVP